MFETLLPFTDPVMIFAFLLTTALVAPLVAEKVNLPGIIGLIVAGIIFGPHGLNVLERGPEVEMFGTIGLLYIMFLAGLELDLIQFMKHKHHSGVFGGLTFGIPLVLGTLMGRYLLGFTWPAAILLSTMFSSHTLITYPIASRLGLGRHQAVTTTVGGTLITDTAALLILAIITGLHQGEPGIMFWTRLITYMVIYVGAVVYLLPKIGHWFFRNIASEGIVAFTGVFSGVFLCSYMAHVAGLEPIIGAFLAGLTLNSLIPENSTLMNRIQFVGHSLFIPFFMISVGMLVNIGLLFADKQTITVAVSMVLAGIVTKYLAADFTRRIFSYTRDEGMLIYGLSVNQAAATLAAVLVGYEIGIFSEPVLTGTIIMILVTSLAGSWITDRFARRVALSEEEKPYSASDNPHRIMVPLGSPDTAEKLIELAILIRRKNSSESLYPVTVVETGENTNERLAKAEKLLGKAVVKSVSGDIPVVPITRASTSITTGIQRALTDHRISTVVMGWKGHVKARSRTFGPVLDPIVENNSQMIIISRCLEPFNTIKRVVVAIPPLIENQPGFETAVRSIKTLTHQLGASLLTVSVSDTVERVHDIISKNPPKLNENKEIIDKWEDLIPWLDSDVISHQDDLLILFMVRKGRLAWRPNLSKLPRFLSERFDDMNFTAVYPPELPWKANNKTENIKANSCISLLPPEHIRLNLENTDIKNAILKLLNPTFPSEEELKKEISVSLKEMSDTEPMELLPGAVLLHAHIPHIESSTAFLGVNKTGWDIPHTTRKVKVLFLLLSSKEASPEVHLKALAELVGPIHHTQENVVKKIIQSKSVGGIIDILSTEKEENNNG